MDQRRRGFTLIELLVVISIVAILIALVATTGVLVIGRQNKSTTQGILSSLDRALEEYVIETGAFPPFLPDTYNKVPGRRVFTGSPTLNEMETYLDRDQVRHPDASVFLQQAAGIGEVNSIISGIGERFTMTTELMDTDPTDKTNEMGTTPSIMDAWADSAAWIATSKSEDVEDSWAILDSAAHLIFYVHPSNRLAQDLYGRCVNGRPYFFSAGPDGLYGTTTQLSSDGAPDPSSLGVNDEGVELTFSELAIEGLEDNLYSYDVGPAHDDEHFNSETR